MDSKKISIIIELVALINRYKKEEKLIHQMTRYIKHFHVPEFYLIYLRPKMEVHKQNRDKILFLKSQIDIKTLNINNDKFSKLISSL